MNGAPKWKPKRPARTPKPTPWGARCKAVEPVLKLGARRYVCRLRQGSQGVEVELSPSRINAELDQCTAAGPSAMDAIVTALKLSSLFLPSEADEQALCVAALRGRPLVLDVEDRELRLLGFVGA